MPIGHKDQGQVTLKFCCLKIVSCTSKIHANYIIYEKFYFYRIKIFAPKTCNSTINKPRATNTRLTGFYILTFKLCLQGYTSNNRPSGIAEDFAMTYSRASSTDILYQYITNE